MTSSSRPARGEDAAQRRSARRRRLRRWAFALSLGLSLGLGEVAVRLWAPQRSAFSGHLLYRADPDLDYTLDPGHPEINSRGLRDHERPLRKPAGVRRVLVLGDSFTYGATPRDQTIAAALQRRLGGTVDVINAGVPGWCPRQEVGWLVREGLAYEPDAIVLCYFVGNDLEECLLPPLRSEDGELAPRGEVSAAHQLWRKLRTKSQLYMLLRRVPERIWLGLQGDDLETRRYHKIEHHRMSVCLPRESSQERWGKAWELSRGYLTQLREAAGERPVVLLLIPDEVQVDAALRIAILARYGEQDRGYDWDMPQTQLRELAQELDFQVVDVLPELRRRTQAGERLYLPLDSHWNAAGNDCAARALAEASALRSLAAPR